MKQKICNNATATCSLKCQCSTSCLFPTEGHLKTFILCCCDCRYLSFLSSANNSRHYIFRQSVLLSINYHMTSNTSLIDTQLHSSTHLISGCQHSTPVSWLPVLSHVDPPLLCRKASSDKMLQIITAHPNWPVYADVFEHPPPRLTSRRPIW